MAAQESNKVLSAWETSSQYWNKHQTRIEQMFAPITRALIETAQIQPGQHVLDIGGGTGQPALTIAQHVAEQGSVAYTDPSKGMVQTARDEAARRQLTNIKFYQAPAESLPFPSDMFDVAVGRLSVMFVPNVPAGLREVLRVLKPGGRISMLVWSDREANPFFQIISDILNRYVPAEPEDEDAPAAFRFARRGKLASLMGEAGATSISETIVPFQIEAPISVEEFWELRTEMSDTFRGKLATVEPNQIAKMKDETINAVGDYFIRGTMSFPAQVLIVSGSKGE